MTHYNYDFEIMAVAVTLIIYFYVRVQYDHSERNTRFTRFMLTLAFAAGVDIAGAWMINHPAGTFPNWLNCLVNTGYFTLALVCEFLYYRYIDTYLGKDRDNFRKINHAVNITAFYINFAMIVVNLISALTVRTGWIFYFDANGIYQQGSLYLLSSIIAYWFFINGMILALIYRKRLTTLQVVSIGVFTLLEISTVLYQVVVEPSLLLTYFGASLMALMMVFTLETPDYQKLRRTMEELEEARREADAANNAKSNFLANMSHEIRTPINGVLGMNAMILKESKDPKIIEYAQNVEGSGRGLLALVNDVLDISKIEMGRLEINEVNYSFARVLGEVYNMVQVRAKEKGLLLNISMDPEIPEELFGDETHVRQILSNLVTNAVKFTNEGSVDILVAQEILNEKMTRLIVTVKDTGIGILKEDLDKIFDVYQQMDVQKLPRAEGTGMGLRIAKQLAKSMHGDIYVDSEYGKGSTFRVTMEQKIALASPIGDFWDHYRMESISESGAFTAPEAQILVVDDIPMNLKVVSGLLKETRIKIDTASSGRQAIELARSKYYDVIFLDHLMPEMDGIETLQTLRSFKDFLNEDTPVVALTANAIAGARETYLAAGFAEYLSKPIREADLCRVLIKYLPEELVHWANSGGREDYRPLAEALREKKPKTEEYKEVEQVGEYDELKQRFPELTVENGMAFCGDSEEFYLEMLDEFTKLDLNDTIRKERADENWKNYTVHAHALKSSARTIGADELSEHARLLEEAAKAEDSDYIAAHQEEVLAEYDKLAATLRDRLH